MKISMYWKHFCHEIADVATSDPRRSYLLLAIISAYCGAILLWPGEKLDEPAFRILHEWGFTDFRLAVLLFVHSIGMLRAIVKLREREEMDWWMTVLGFWLFGVVPITIDLSLQRVTFLSGVSLGVATLAAWLMFTRNRKKAGSSIPELDQQTKGNTAP